MFFDMVIDSRKVFNDLIRKMVCIQNRLHKTNAQKSNLIYYEVAFSFLIDFYIRHRPLSLHHLSQTCITQNTSKKNKQNQISLYSSERFSVQNRLMQLLISSSEQSTEIPDASQYAYSPASYCFNASKSLP